MRVLHVIDSMELAGAERVVESLVRWLNQRGIENDVCCLSHKGELGERLEKENLRIFSLEKKEGVDWKIFWNFFWKVKKRGYDLIHFHNIGPLIYGFLTSYLLHIPAVVTIHGRIGWKKGRTRLLNRYYFRFPKKIVTVWKQGEEMLIRSGVPANKLMTIYNGVEINEEETKRGEEIKFPFDTNKKFIIGTVGNLTAVKNHLELLKAFKIFSDGLDVDEARLVIIGEGRERENLEKFILDNHLEKLVFLLGRKRNIPGYLDYFDIFVLPSTSEGLSIALLEAMGSGKAVVAMNVGGNSEVIQNGHSGILISTEGSRFSKQMAEILRELHDDSQKRDFLAKNGRQKIESSFNCALTVARYEQLYKDCVKSGDRVSEDPTLGYEKSV